MSAARGASGLRRRLSAAAIGTLAAAAYLVFLISNASRVAGGSDSSGYLNEARALAKGRTFEPIPAVAGLGLDRRFDGAFIPLGYVSGARPGTMNFLYPPGLPLHMAAAAAVAGWNRGPFWVAPLAAVACLALLFRLARDLGLSPAAAATAAAVLGAHPAFLLAALQPLSDVPATAWCLAAVLSARRSRVDARWAALAGGAFGIAFLVRPADVLVLPAVLAYVGFDRRRLAAFSAGGTDPFLFWVAFNRSAFGSPFATGYGRGGLWSALAWGNFSARARHYAHWLSATLTGLVLAGWLAAPFDRRIARRDRAALVVWFAAFFLFYDFYLPYETWWYLRFLLPAFPALILGFAAAGEHAIEAGTKRFARPSLFRAIGGAAVGIVLLLELRQVRRLHVRGIVEDEKTYTAASAWSAGRIPAGALVVAMQMSGCLRYYGGIPIVRWDGLPGTLWPALVSAADRRGVPLYALLFPFEEDEAMKRVPGPWTRLGAEHGVALWRRTAAPPGTRR